MNADRCGEAAIAARGSTLLPESYPRAVTPGRFCYEGKPVSRALKPREARPPLPGHFDGQQHTWHTARLIIGDESRINVA